MATIGIALCFTVMMISGWSSGLSKIMQLTFLSGDFKLFIIGLGACYWILAWAGERWLFQPFARWLGTMKQSVFKRPKTRKQYKLILEQMKF
jgi:cation-transporting ATPase 13A3/4/5